PLAPTTRSGASWRARAALALAVAVAGAAVAVAAGGREGEPELLTATGGFVTAPDPETVLPPGDAGQAPTIEWPAGEDGWTIVLASLPQTEGRRAAEARARRARRAGLAPVGILDSSRYASLHPGYWVVFTGVFASEAEATSALQPARRVSRTATVRRVVP
ncbi:MAG TPA: hypothetical protein VNJ53_06815, partial [Gaiellaceae bacterium]|nr:hypothetical protein [Gaiellaceae bacterium]